MPSSNDIIKSITSFFTSYVFPQAGTAIKEFWIKTDDIPFWKLLSDFFFIARGLWIFLFFDFLVFIFFIILPQGSDILLSVLEDTGNSYWSTLIFLIIGIVAWSIIAEFGSRYTMYVTDNSGYSLSDERVEWRKFLQRFFTRFSLYFPSAIILAGLIIVALANFSFEELKGRWDILGTLGAIYVVFMLLYKSYSPWEHPKDEKATIAKPENSSDKILPEKQKRPKWLQLSKEEEDWASRLYGIYNDYVFKYPSKEVLEDINLLLVPFTMSKDRKAEINSYNVAVFLRENENSDHEYCIKYLNDKSNEKQRPEKAEKIQNTLLNWPQETLIAKLETETEISALQVIKKFILKRFYQRSDDIWARWFYRIPFSFYGKLHMQLLILVSISIVFLTIFSLLGNQAYQLIGAAGLVIISFACWCGIYIGLIFLEKAQLKFRANWRLILFLWVVFCSNVNNDHPARINSSDLNINSQRLGLNEHFNKWFTHFKNDPRNCNPSFDSLLNRENISKEDVAYPVIFVCAEGGASRTGAFTAMMLSKLQDSFPVFNSKIYAFSSVSGGTLGVGLYNAIANFRKLSNNDRFSDSVNATLTKVFFSRDHLSAAIGKLFFCEVLQAFWPAHVSAFDRAIALEESWEWGYERAAVLNDDENVFSTDYFRVYDTKKPYPAWFINTTSVETGLQSWLTNVIPDSSMPAYDVRDLWRHITGTTLYSTAINFSSRFPIISPSAMVSEGNILRRHYVDGGYVENCGTQTMYEILCALNKNSFLLNEHVKPIVLMLEFGNNDNQRPAGNKFGNDWADILTGIYNTRSGRGTVAKDNLKHITQDVLHGKLIEIPFNESVKNVPLNWILSNKAVDNIGSYCDTMIKKYEEIQLLKRVLNNGREVGTMSGRLASK